MISWRPKFLALMLGLVAVSLLADPASTRSKYHHHGHHHHHHHHAK